MQKWIIVPLGAALLAAGCSDMQDDQMTSRQSGERSAEAQTADTRAQRGQSSQAVLDRPERSASPERAGETRTPATHHGQSSQAVIDTGVPGKDRTKTTRSEDMSSPSMSDNRMSGADTASAPRADGRTGMGTGDLTNQEVREAQQALAGMGLYDGEIDGLYGPRTIQAVGRFQDRNDLPQTYALTDETQRRLQQAVASADGAGNRSANGTAAQTGSNNDMRQASGDSMAARDDRAQQQQQDTQRAGAAATARSDDVTGAGRADTAVAANARSYRSIGRTASFEGAVAGGYEARDLIGSEVVSDDGRTVGEISDVLVSDGGDATHVVVEVARDLGIGTDRRVVMDIRRLRQEGDRFAADMEIDTLASRPAYVRQGDSWVVEENANGSR